MEHPKSTELKSGSSEQAQSNDAAAHAQRESAIRRATMFRAGNRTIDKFGNEQTHDSISAAKRRSREHGLGVCVAQRKGEDLFSVMRERIARAAAEAKAKADAEAKATKDAAAAVTTTDALNTTEAQTK